MYIDVHVRVAADFYLVRVPSEVVVALSLSLFQWSDMGCPSALLWEHSRRTPTPLASEFSYDFGLAVIWCCNRFWRVKKYAEMTLVYFA